MSSHPQRWPQRQNKTSGQISWRLLFQVDVKPPTKKATQKAEEKKEQWAIKVDVNSPVTDFYKRIPDMAYKVTLTKAPSSSDVVIIMYAIPCKNTGKGNSNFHLAHE